MIDDVIDVIDKRLKCDFIRFIFTNISYFLGVISNSFTFAGEANSDMLFTLL